MDAKTISEYCLSKKGAYIAYPFGDIPICFKVASRIFLELYPLKDDFKITLSCDPFAADFLRQQYKGIIVPGYHCPPQMKPYRNTVYLEGRRLKHSFIMDMIDNSYNIVLNKLSKTERMAILETEQTTE